MILKRDHRGWGVAILLVLTLIGSRAVSQAAIPSTLNFQGYLTNATGTPVNGPVEMVFSLYVQEAGGSALWSEAHPDVQVTGGIYSVLLGETTPLNLAFDGPYYLGVRVGSDQEMTPRLPLSSVGYAFRAGTADQALIQGFPVGPIVPAANQVLKFNGTNWVPSTVNLSTDTSGILPVSKVEFITISQNPRSNTLTAVDSTGTVGGYTSITIGTDGLPVISYFDVTNGDLKVAKCANPFCLDNWSRR